MRVAWGAVPEGTPRRGVAWELIRNLTPGARLTNPCPACGGPHGPVRLHGTDVVASVAYAGGFAVVAVAEAAATGIDAEAGAPGRIELDRVLGAGATLRDWVRVEAVLKADGRGLRVDASLVDIRASGERTWTARIADGPTRYDGVDVDGPPGLVVSLALAPRP